MNQSRASKWDQETDANYFFQLDYWYAAINVRVANVESYDDYMLINYYLGFR